MANNGDLPSDTIRQLLDSTENDNLSELESDDESDAREVESGHESDIQNLASDDEFADWGNGDNVSLSGNEEDEVVPEPTIDEPTQNAQDPDWREWKEDDLRFDEFNYVNDAGFHPPPNFDRSSELSYFQLFFTDDLLNQIVEETNRYAGEKINSLRPLPKKSMWLSWKDLTLVEFKAFLGVIINMGMHPKPDIDDYFSNDWLDKQPFFKDVFSKERFLQIFWNLHLCPPPDRRVLGVLSRSAKVKNVVLYLDKRFREFYCPSANVSIDESTIGFKGRVIFKVYNKDKPQKWGIKVFVLSDSCNGYVCSILPYMGIATTNFLVRPELLVTSRVVLTLVENIEQSFGNIEGLHVFTDRFYSSLEISQVLLEKKVHHTGTIMKNRKGLPSEVKKKTKLKKGHIKAFRKNDNVSVVQWKDKREVLMITSLYDDSTEEVRRRVKNGEEEIVTKPSVICRYNENMGGVDVADHFFASYPFVRKTVKWWRKVFFWLLEVGIVNGFILKNNYRDPGMPSMRQKKFRKNLAKQLVGDIRNENSRKRGRKSHEDEARLVGKHFIYESAEKNRRDCVVCSSRKGTRHRTIFFCNTCEDKPPLHPGICFERYHSLKKFKTV